MNSNWPEIFFHDCDPNIHRLLDQPVHGPEEFKQFHCDDAWTLGRRIRDDMPGLHSIMVLGLVVNGRANLVAKTSIRHGHTSKGLNPSAELVRIEQNEVLSSVLGRAIRSELRTYLATTLNLDLEVVRDICSQEIKDTNNHLELIFLRTRYRPDYEVVQKSYLLALIPRTWGLEESDQGLFTCARLVAKKEWGPIAEKGKLEQLDGSLDAEGDYHMATLGGS
ncbi:uncharacterized protein KD926_004413 [Aspergillus affinis]|uniref:uncharacterized protein n=1 Tax=Aspergillus affinis TaxID=1070780 RepID=UPI0022FED026|nr:uncharacterized protein KD926_004413 [Aspergillus affinis]KAI9043229.1 hypothetical protein KD926_004413 [Aspergillus affinis]